MENNSKKNKILILVLVSIIAVVAAGIYFTSSEKAQVKIIPEIVSDVKSDINIEVRTDEAIPTSGSYRLKIENSLSVEESNERAVIEESNYVAEEKELKIVDVPLAEENLLEDSEISIDEEAPVILEETENI